MKKNMLCVFTIALISVIAFVGLNALEKKEFDINDYGKQPWTVDVEKLTLDNHNFRTTKWTGKNLQLTVMAIPPEGEIGLEVHPEGDQFIRIESGTGRILMGDAKDKLTFDKPVSDDWAILIPAGQWHNVINTGDKPLKIYVLYAPPEHAAGTIHKTYEESEADHHHH
jgi:mannose-6-phosphate isomerase-like protein (cupin superfamily)